ncbi:MAG: hypothetical protein EBZ36_01950 [Acidobacteria bacterium]|nr:hypothetical protein [Acidobacteriota bacterium]
MASSGSLPSGNGPMEDPMNSISEQDFGFGEIGQGWCEPGVSMELAVHRSRQLSELDYQLDLRLDAGLTRLDGRIRIGLCLARSEKADQPVILDFRDQTSAGKTTDGSIAGMAVNGRSVRDYQQINGHIIIPSNHFRHGHFRHGHFRYVRNEISIDFETTVARGGRPLIRFEESPGGDRFAYLLSVPMDASLAFPCFDQPDLKGRFRLSLAVATEMAVITNSEPSRNPTIEAGGLRYHFEPTPPISTYLFTFAVGPFARLESVIDGCPLRLFVRRSQLLRAENQWPAIRDLSGAGLRHLSSYLGCRFPFAKYDQVLLPGFPFRGMEHAGATFLREESVLLTDSPGRSELLSRAALILHELAHQWFGDLVTMRWFDDLWIKEGFANLLAYDTMAAIGALGLDKRTIWMRFYLAHRPGATAIDRSAGTTPIHQSIQNLLDAKSAYGAIVYQKAPMILRSLAFSLGAEVFQAGVRLFLRRHAFGVADRHDLISALEEVSGQSLEAWAAAWITGSGLPRVETVWEEPAADTTGANGANGANGPTAVIRLIQRNWPGEHRCWPIDTRIRLALANGTDRVLRVIFDGPSSSPIEPGADCWLRFILANDEGESYGIFLPDGRSLRALINEVDETPDPLLRILLRGTIDDCFTEGRLATDAYIGMLRESIGRERDEDHLEWLLGRLTEISVRHQNRESISDRLSATEERLISAISERETAAEKLHCLRTFRQLASSRESIIYLKRVLADSRPLIGLSLTAHDRWAIIASLLALGDPNAELLFEQERATDQGDSSPKLAWITAAARPDQATKDRYFNQYLQPGDIPEDWIVDSLTAFNDPRQSELTSGYLLPALTALPRLKRQRKIFFILSWLNAFIGGHPASTALRVVDNFLGSHRPGCHEIDPDLVAKIRQVADRMRRPAN